MLTVSASSGSHGRVPLQPTSVVVSLTAEVLVAAIGRTWTDTAVGPWYDDLDKPAWTPPVLCSRSGSR